MTTTFWSYILGEKLWGLIYVIFATAVLVGFVVFSIVCRIKLSKKRHTCIHEPECLRSKGACKECNQYERCKK